MKKLVYIFILCLSYNVYSQTEIEIEFDAKLNGKSLELNKNYVFKDDSLTISSFRFYISDIILLGDGADFIAENSFHLIDIEKGKNKIKFKYPPGFKFKGIELKLGIDSATNVAGVYGGDLDPTKGMYWTWQSGYINFKLEGTSSNCKSRKNEFFFHLGGYLAPNQTVQTLKFETVQEKNKIEIDLDAFLNQLDFSKEDKIMSPGKRSKELSILVGQTFKIVK